MYYSFIMKNGKTLNVFYNNLFKDEQKRTHGTVTWCEFRETASKKYTRTVHIDENGRRFFTWNKEKIFLDNFNAFEPKELVKNVYDKTKNFCGEDICRTLQKYGIDSLRLYIKTKKLEIIDMPGIGRLSFKVHSNFENKENYDLVEYRFIEEYLRMPEDGYKLKLVPANEEDCGVYPKEDYYIDDLADLLISCKDTYQLAANINF